MDFKTLYPESYSHKQQEKFLNRASNHWRHRIENCFHYIDALEGKRVLDLGCNIGTFAIEAVLRGASEAVGVDFDAEALLLAGKNARDLHIDGRCRFALCDVSSLGLKSESMDIIMAEDIFEHLPDPLLIKTLHECHRVLKKGGIMVGHTFPTRYEPLFHRKRLYLQMMKTCFMGKNSRRHIVALYDKHFGSAYEARIRHTQHCNPQDHEALRRRIRETGFRVEAYKTHNLYDFDEKPFLRRLLSKIPEAHRHISCKLVKEEPADGNS